MGYQTLVDWVSDACNFAHIPDENCSESAQILSNRVCGAVVHTVVRTCLL